MQLDTIAAKLRAAAENGDHTKIEHLVETLTDTARIDEMNDLLIDLHDAGEITADGIEFAVENNGAHDPRK